VIVADLRVGELPFLAGLLVGDNERAVGRRSFDADPRAVVVGLDKRESESIDYIDGRDLAGLEDFHVEPGGPIELVQHLWAPIDREDGWNVPRLRFQCRGGLDLLRGIPELSFSRAF
jgi:hypothetical protein